MDKIIRLSPPNQYDQAPYGTECVVLDEGRKIKEVYIQKNPDDCNPIWINIKD